MRTGFSDTTNAIVDTNIAVYAYDADEGRKHERARQLLRALSDSGRLVYSTQVLNEFYSTMIRIGRKRGWSHDDVAEMVRELAATGKVSPLTEQVTFRALDVLGRHPLPFWDALIWAAAREHAVPIVYSEDFPHETSIEGVRFLNPFRMPEEALV